MFKWKLSVPLDEMSLDQVLMWWEQGQEMIVTEALTTAAAVWGGLGKKAPPKIITSSADQKPDKAAFYARYGDKIKRG